MSSLLILMIFFSKILLCGLVFLRDMVLFDDAVTKKIVTNCTAVCININHQFALYLLLFSNFSKWQKNLCTDTSYIL